MRFVGCFKKNNLQGWTCWGSSGDLSPGIHERSSRSMDDVWRLNGHCNGGVENDEQHTEIYPGKNRNASPKFNIAYWKGEDLEDYRPNGEGSFSGAILNFGRASFCKAPLFWGSMFYRFWSVPYLFFGVRRLLRCFAVIESIFSSFFPASWRS